ncbi:MAG: hypothetical protein V3V19_04320 [Cocleimonas sp.]
MKIIGILLIILGLIGATIGGMAFGDIGIIAFLTSAVAILSGVGFILSSNKNTLAKS